MSQLGNLAAMNPAGGFTGQVALVTGASSGIGLATATAPPPAWCWALPYLSTAASSHTDA
jgi:hypothetical protein